MRAVTLITLFAGLILAGCDSPGKADRPAKDDGYSAGFMSACTAYPQYVRRGADRATRHCNCVYSKTMANLTEVEAQVAAFYLYGQMGAKPETLEKFKDMNLNAMGKASDAIGKAVSACPGP